MQHTVPSFLRLNGHPTTGLTETVGTLFVQNMLPSFLRHEFWERKGNIPALALLLQAFLRRAHATIVSKSLLNPVLGIFQKLLSSAKHSGDAYTLLSAILAYVPLQELEASLPAVFRLLFQVRCSCTALPQAAPLFCGPRRSLARRLQRHLLVHPTPNKPPVLQVLTGPRKSTKNTVAFVTTVCKFACWHTPTAAAAAMDAAQAGSSVAIFSQVAVNNLAHVNGKQGRRAVGLGLARVLADLPSLRAVRPYCELCYTPS